ncbi:hypothetical protein CASFOL_008315 [Castilleja foliolosa]|uniref:KIB1-4 beta-propeller domain-containing protein n=1 Tax=Castilleja foliolosa TaxID=1961234 RepID=A0ABD3E0K8_9LAMI
MALSILKITGTGTSVRSIFRSLSSYRGAWMVSTATRLAEAQVSSLSSSDDDSPSSSSPLLMLSPNNYNMSYDLYSFAKNRLFTIPKSEKSTSTKIIVGSSHGWLACFNLRRNELYLSNPLSGRRVDLPPIDNLPIYKPNLRSGTGINKIIISCSDPESKECRAMMIFNYPSNELAFCCPGISSTGWTTMDSPNKDIVYCPTRELLFTLNGYKILEFKAWDLRNPLSPSLVWSCKVNELECCSNSGGHSNLVDDDVVEDDYVFLNYQNYLVASQQGELFLVHRYVYQHVLPNGVGVKIDPEDDDDDFLFTVSKYPPKTADYKVFKIVPEGDGGKKVFMNGHLNDQVMFIGWLSHGMAMPAADVDGFRPNTICFTDDAFTLSKEARGRDNGIFDYKNRTFHPCYYPLDYQSLKKKIMPPPLWLTTN